MTSLFLLQPTLCCYRGFPDPREQIFRRPGSCNKWGGMGKIHYIGTVPPAEQRILPIMFESQKENRIGYWAEKKNILRISSLPLLYFFFKTMFYKFLPAKQWYAEGGMRRQQPQASTCGASKLWERGGRGKEARRHGAQPQCSPAIQQWPAAGLLAGLGPLN